MKVFLARSVSKGHAIKLAKKLGGWLEKLDSPYKVKQWENGKTYSYHVYAEREVEVGDAQINPDATYASLFSGVKIKF